MLVSIIVPAYNAAATIEECLQACLAQSHAETEVIVIDDESTDDTADIVRALDVRYIRQPNAGPAAARNRGASVAMGDVLAFTDADCVPARDWIVRLLEGFEHGVVAVGGTYGIRNESHLLARIVHQEIQSRHERYSGDVDFLGSFNVAILREAFDAVGGFDESFTIASAEDNDLAYRLQDRGGTLRFTPNALVAHYHPTKLLPYLGTQMRHGFWRMKLYAKHPRRGSGDHYAGLTDLLGPPLSLILFSGVILIPFVSHLYFTAAIIVLGLCYIVLMRRIDGAISRRAGAAARVAFRAMAILRDAARGVGLIGGVWTFVVLRKGAV